MVRQFYFRNQDNEILDLMGRKTDFLNAPQGLGFEVDVETVSLNQSLKVLDIKNNFIDIQGEMLFKDYGDYQNFSNFVTKAETLYFHQIINADIKEGYVECLVRGLEKTEKDYVTGYLKCPISIQPYTFWQVEKIIKIEASDNEVIESGVLPYTLPFVLAKSDMISNLRQIEIINNGVVDSPLKLLIKGVSDNPEWFLNSETLLTSGGLNILIQFNQVVKIDSTDGHMIVSSGSAFLDEYLYTDRKNYLYLNRGKNKLFLRNFYEGEVKWIEHYYTL